MAVQTVSFPMRGGVDQSTPLLQVAMGALSFGINYECLPMGGYRRIKGYELFDGSVAPSAPAVVPGEGPVRGVWLYKGDVYAFRDDVSEGRMYKSTTSGWVQQSLGDALRFDAGNFEFLEGQQITGLTSGATAIIRRISTTTGTSGTGTLKGVLVISDIVGGPFQDNEEIQYLGVTRATADGANYTQSLPKGGDYVFDNHNFYASADSLRMYFANGVGDAYEWDGTYLAPIIGAEGAFPDQIIGFQEHLWLGYDAEGVVIYSSLGEPTKFDALTGAGEIGLGDSVREFHVMQTGALGVGCEKSFHLIIAETGDTFSRRQLREHGVRPRTMQEINSSVMALDDVGVQLFSPSDTAASLVSGSMSEMIFDELTAAVNDSVYFASSVNREKSQYRIFLGKVGYYFTMTINAMAGVTKVLFPNAVVCCCDGLDSAGRAVSFFGSEDGEVFQMDRTNFFNGTNIRASLVLPITFPEMVTRRKAFRKVVFEMVAENEIPTIQVQPDLDLVVSSQPTLYTMQAPIGGGGAWSLAQWNNFLWSARLLRGQAETPLEGHGTYLGIIIYSPGDEDSSHTFYSATLHFSLRRLNR